MLPLVQRGAWKLIKDGNLTDAWTDPWMPALPNFRPAPCSAEVVQSPGTTVATLMLDNPRLWDWSTVQTLFNDPATCRATSKIFLSQADRPDGWSLILEKSGYFTAKSMYKSLCPEVPGGISEMEPADWKKIVEILVSKMMNM